ncbi:MAG: GNAT family N-acetyltransferase [Gemmatimonadales bacterium]|nr:MAG: GNAT family N-acetyltransferase [Gemmatimonadales bacterium]
MYPFAMASSTPQGSRPALPSVRRATEADVRSLAALWALAFPGERSAEERARGLREGGAWGGIENCWVATTGSRLDGAFRTLPLVMHLLGRPVPTLGLAAVAVAPHARRRGLGAHLCRAALRIGRDRGDLLAALYPFRTDFYARLGFALAGELHRYRFPPEALPAFDGVDRVYACDDPLATLPSLYETLLPSSHGLVKRSSKRWEAVLAASPLAFGIHGRGGASPEGTPRGYLLGSLRKLPRGAGREFRVTEFLAADRDSYRAGLGWLSAQRDAWRQVTLDALPGEQLHGLLTHPQLAGTSNARVLWFPSATILRGPMVRILDTGGLLERLQPARGTVLDLEDSEVPENRGRWEVATDGSAGVRRTGEPGPDALHIADASALLAAGRFPGLELPRPGFSPLLGLPDFRLLDDF